jgi:hypothetical protein
MSFKKKRNLVRVSSGVPQEAINTSAAISHSSVIKPNIQEVQVSRTLYNIPTG